MSQTPRPPRPPPPPPPPQEPDPVRGGIPADPLPPDRTPRPDPVVRPDGTLDPWPEPPPVGRPTTPEPDQVSPQDPTPGRSVWEPLQAQLRNLAGLQARLGLWILSRRLMRDERRALQVLLTWVLLLSLGEGAALILRPR